MPWTTPVYDRDNTDYFNVADWTRIYNNASYVNGLFTSALGYDIFFLTITAPTITTIGGQSFLDNFNNLARDIEYMRYWAHHFLARYMADPLNDEIKQDWQIGVSAAAPDYSTINLWEYSLYIIYTVLNSWADPTLSQYISFGQGGTIQFGSGGFIEFGGG